MVTSISIDDICIESLTTLIINETFALQLNFKFNVSEENT